MLIPHHLLLREYSARTICSEINYAVCYAFVLQPILSLSDSLSQDIGEMVYTERPDWQSVMTYVTAIYKYFET